MDLKYGNANNIRFSCAYLFRIKINDKYLLVKDEQGRGTFQPVGGVYKYFDDSIFSRTHAVQCTRFGNNSDLDNDLRIIVPRKYVHRFKRWYRKEVGRETPDNLYREFQEEIIERIGFLDLSAFDTIQYRYCGVNIDPSRWGEKDMQVRIADIVELIPTPQQSKVLLSLLEGESDVYHFATKEEIYNFGCTDGNLVPTISPHTIKILPEEETKLKHNRRTNKCYTCTKPVQAPAEESETWKNIEKTDTSKPFTFISYNSLHGKMVWDFCFQNNPPLENVWIDRKQVSENWQNNVKNALESSHCEKALVFISKEYLLRSTACYYETSLIVDNNVPHLVILVDVDINYIKKTIRDWTYCDVADKEKLRSFKKLFYYDDDNGHINCSFFSLNSKDLSKMWEAYSNLKKQVS